MAGHYRTPVSSSFLHNSGAIRRARPWPCWRLPVFLTSDITSGPTEQGPGFTEGVRCVCCWYRLLAPWLFESAPGLQFRLDYCADQPPVLLLHWLWGTLGSWGTEVHVKARKTGLSKLPIGLCLCSGGHGGSVRRSLQDLHEFGKVGRVVPQTPHLSLCLPAVPLRCVVFTSIQGCLLSSTFPHHFFFYFFIIIWHDLAEHFTYRSS